MEARRIADPLRAHRMFCSSDRTTKGAGGRHRLVEGRVTRESAVHSNGKIDIVLFSLVSWRHRDLRPRDCSRQGLEVSDPVLRPVLSCARWRRGRRTGIAQLLRAAGVERVPEPPDSFSISVMRLSSRR